MRILLSDEQIAIIKKALLAVGGDDANGVRIHIEDKVAEHDDPDRQKYVKAAQDKIHKDGEVEIDDDADISKGEDPGAYVQAWVWVYAEDAGVNAAKAGG